MIRIRFMPGLPGEREGQLMETMNVVLADQVALAVAEGEGVYQPGEPFAIEADGGSSVWVLQQVGFTLKETIQALRYTNGLDRETIPAYNGWMASIN